VEIKMERMEQKLSAQPTDPHSVQTDRVIAELRLDMDLKMRDLDAKLKTMEKKGIVELPLSPMTEHWQNCEWR